MEVAQQVLQGPTQQRRVVSRILQPQRPPSLALPVQSQAPPWIRPLQVALELGSQLQRLRVPVARDPPFLVPHVSRVLHAPASPSPLALP